MQDNSKNKGTTSIKCQLKPVGVIDFDKLGYTPERAKELRHLPELENVAKP
ncbi:MAG: hypothetical protein HQL78_02585 [Magnetococcales bacterium]|nr:hypothetical protein [Magnetococcales bacterium]